mgnify:CR=1 FL=1
MKDLRKFRETPEVFYYAILFTCIPLFIGYPAEKYIIFNFQNSFRFLCLLDFGGGVLLLN